MTRWFSTFAVGAALGAALMAAPGAAAATCANEGGSVRQLGKARAEKAVVCLLNNAGRPGRDARRDRYVSRAAQRVIREQRYSIPHIVDVLRDVGFFRSGGKGFMRCFPVRVTATTTPKDIVGYIAARASFVVAGPHVHVGLGLTEHRWMLIGGRRTNR